MNATINQRNTPDPIVAKEIHPSNSSKERNPSPLAAEKMQSISHISAAAPKIIVRISKCNFFLSLNKNSNNPEINAAPSETRKYVI